MSNLMRFRSLILGALVVVLMVANVYAADPVIKDVPQGHWAHDAVSKLVAKGYLSTNTLGEFQGTQTVDRYNLAQALARLLDDIESGKVRVVSEDVELLRKLTNEYRAELVEYYAQQQKTAVALDETIKRINVLDEKINETIIVLDDVTVRTEALQRSANDSDIAQAAKTAALQSDITDLQLQVTNSINQLQAEAEALRLSLRNTEDSLRREAQALVSGNSASQDQKRGALESKVTSVEIRASDLERRMSIEEGKSATLSNQMNNQRDQLSTQITQSATDLRQELDAVRTEALQRHDADIKALETKLQVQIDKLNQAQADLNVQIAQQKAELTSLINANATADAAAVRRIDQLEQEQSKLQANVGSQGVAIKDLQNTQISQGEQLNAALGALEMEFGDRLASTGDYQAAQTTRITNIERYNAEQDLAFERQISAERSARELAVKALEAKQADLASQVDTERKNTLAAINALDAKQAAANAALSEQLQASIASVANERAVGDAALHQQLTEELASQSSRIDAETAARTAAVEDLDKRLAAQTAALAEEVVTKFEQMESEGALSEQALLNKMQSELDSQQAQIDNERKAKDAAIKALDEKQAAAITKLSEELQASITSVANESAAGDAALHQQLTEGLASQSSRIDAETAARTAAVEDLDKKLATQTAALADEVVAKFAKMESEGALSEQALLNKMQSELDSQQAAIAAERAAREAASKAHDTKYAADQAAISQQLAKLESLAADGVKRDQEQDARHQADTERLTGLINAETVARQGAISELDAKLMNQTKDLAAQLATQFDSMSSESAQSEAAILTQLQLELGKQQDLIAAEKAARESDLEALSVQMQVADRAVQTAVDERLSLSEKELNQHSEGLAAQQMALTQLEERFMTALQAQDEAHQQQIAALQADLAQTQKELAAVQTKLLLVESRIGLSDTQLEALDRRVNEKVDQYITARYMNEAQLDQQIQELELKLKTSEEASKQELNKVNTLSWVKSVMATLIGVFVIPW